MAEYPLAKTVTVILSHRYRRAVRSVRQEEIIPLHLVLARSWLEFRL